MNAPNETSRATAVVARARAPLVVVVLTKDEEVNIGKAIRSVDGRAPVLVVDSQSRDRTCEIATSMGAEVVVHPFRGYASQRNAALAMVVSRFRWVFFLDADEELTPEVWREIEAVVPDDRIDGVYVGRILRVLGHDLEHGGAGHHVSLRLMRPELARYEREINERVDDSAMRIATLSSKIVHDDHKTILDWVRKHVGYAEREADAYLQRRDDSLEGFSLRSQRARMIGVRWAYNRLPLGVRPVAYFLRTLVWQGGWRDGVPGMAFAIMQSFWYPMLVDVLIYEHRRRPQLHAGGPQLAMPS